MRESWFFFVPFLCSLRAPCALFNLYSAFYRSKKNIYIYIYIYIYIWLLNLPIKKITIGRVESW